VTSLIRSIAFACVLVFAFSNGHAEEIRDYYAEPGLNPFKDSINQHFNEHVDPFSGTLQLKYTDLTIPGNGGMDININRVYTSLQTNQYPVLGLNGLGWTMHFGRIVISRNHIDKLCTQHLYDATTRENPSLELPDGGRELLVINHINNDGSLITRSNWRARCLQSGGGMLVTSPDGTQYTMNQADTFQGEPSWYTTRIEDLHGNWIRIDYRTNAAGIAYVHEIYRSEEGTGSPVVRYEYESPDNAGIALSAITANQQRVEYRYEPINGFLHPFYKQLVEVERPDGRVWEYAYNPKRPDPDPNDGVLEDGPASYSLVRVTYPYGSTIDYDYQYVQFDPGSPERTTSIATKTVAGAGVTGGTWTYAFTPHSSPFPVVVDGTQRQLRYDVTMVTGPRQIQKFYHFGKDYTGIPGGGNASVRPALVGMLAQKEIIDRSTNAVLQRSVSSWSVRRVSGEDFYHGAGYRSWWRDNATYAPVLIAEMWNRDSEVSSSLYYHHRRYYDHDAYGNPGRTVESATLANQPMRQTRVTYFTDPIKWIIGVPQDEVHEALSGEGGAAQTIGEVTRTLNASGQVTRQVSYGVETNYTYTSRGDLETQTDARSKVRRYLNYKRGIAQREELPEGVTLAREVNDRGIVASQSDGRGYTTRFDYDALNRLTAIDFPIKADVSVNYSAGGVGYRRTLTRGSYQQTESINDFGQTREIERRDLTNGAVISRTKQFDADGRETFTSYPNASVGFTTSYDVLGRIRRTEHPDGAGVGYAYDSIDVTVTNERGFATSYRYSWYGTDDSDKVVHFIASPENVGTIIQRDASDNVIRVHQGQRSSDNTISGYAKTYEYDSHQWLVKAFEPETGTKIFTHDEIGNVLSETVNDDAPTLFVYDGLNRRTLSDYPGVAADVSVVYDKNSNVERLTRGVDTRWVYSYDANDNLESETLSLNDLALGARSYAMAHSYSDVDVVATTTYPSGLVVDYAPDAFGRATRVGTFATEVAYHPSGQLRSYRLANGVVTTIALNQRLLAQRIDAGSLLDLNYSYDAAGNVTAIANAIDASKSVRMGADSYDGLDRLKSATGSWGTATFEYDHYSNLRTKRVGSGDHIKVDLDSRYRPYRTRRLNSSNSTYLDGHTEFAYDARGNAVGKSSHTFTSQPYGLDQQAYVYDPASLLVHSRVEKRTGATINVLEKTYDYDGNGQRVLEKARRSYDILYSVHSRGGQLMFEESIASCTRTDYVRLGALTVARSDDQFSLPTVDTDGDGINDCMERQLSLDPNDATDASADRDGDGASNLAEFRAGSSLSVRDTDGDGLTDGQEINQYLTDPTLTDSDGDGLADAVEAGNPQLDGATSDSDHDGVSDYWELQLNTNPNDPLDARDDADNDGFSNRQESLAKSDPSRAATLPARGSLLWTLETGQPFSHSSPIARDGTVYVTGGNTLTAVRPDGTVRWTYSAGYKISAPTIAEDGTIYIVANPVFYEIGQVASRIHALKPDGTVRWIYESVNRFESPIALGSQSRLVVGGVNVTSNGLSTKFLGVIEVISPSGAVIGRTFVSTSSSLDTAPAVAAGGVAYIGDTSGRVYAFNESSAQLWTYGLRSRPVGGASIDSSGTVYFQDTNGWLYAINSAGVLVWERQVAPSQNDGYQRTVTIGNEGTLYVGTAQGNLLALSQADGSQRWSAPLGGSVLTPVKAADGTIYAARRDGAVSAFTSTGTLLWSRDYPAGSPPMLDKDGTLYIGTTFGQLLSIADSGGGLAVAPWPADRHDSASTGYQCFNNSQYSTSVDSDGDTMIDCLELKNGLNPHDPADASVDLDGDGLTNAQELARGTNARVADTDGDGLSDGLEVLTYHTNPLAPDSDRDLIPDGTEIEWRMNPLDAADALADADGDGFSARQELMAGTNPVSASSAPQLGALLRTESALSDPSRSETTLAADGTTYHVTAQGLDARNPDRSRKWFWSATNLLNNAVLGADGTVYVSISRTIDRTELVALSSHNGRKLWSVDLSLLGSSVRNVSEPPSVGPDGLIYQPFMSSFTGYSYIAAVDRLGIVRGVKELRVQSGSLSYPTIVVDHDGRVIQSGGESGISAFRLVSGNFERVMQSESGEFFSGADLAVAVDGTVYVAHTRAFEAYSNSGESLWTIDGNHFEPRVLPDGRVLVQAGNDGGRLRMYSAEGTLLWSHTSAQTPALVGATSIDARNVIHVATATGTLAVSDDGSLLMQTTVPGGMTGVNYPIVQPDGLVWFETRSSRLLVAGNANGLADSWASRHRNHRNQRNAAGVDEVSPDPAPSIALVSPASGSTTNLDVGQQLTATVRAFNLSEGDLSGNVRWTSSLDGELGSGGSLAVNSLTLGTHTITVTITDAAGLSRSDALTVNVGRIGPGLTILYPTDGYITEAGWSLNFNASANDAVDGDLSQAIRWTSSIDGAIGSGGTFSRQLSLGQHVITASVSDSNGTTATATRTVHVRLLPPTVQIASPTVSTVTRGTAVSFQAFVNDARDGNIAAATVWTSSLDGQFGTGGSFSVANLSTGRHQITATATDSDGLTGSAARTLTVTDSANPAPVVSISTPAANAQFYAGDLVRMQASASDSGGSIASMQWSSSRDGALGTGSPLDRTTLSIGEHVLSVVVTDNAGAKAAATRTIRVLPIPDNYPPTVTINSFVEGGVYTQDSVIPLLARAADREHGDVSNSIVWSSSVDGELGRAAAVHATLSAGTHDLTASATDPGGATGSATHRIQVASEGQAMHMVEPFTGSQAFPRNGWEVVNDAGNQTGGVDGAWSVSSGRAVETAGGYRIHSDAIARPGTYLLQTAGTHWTDYSVRLTMRSATTSGTMYGMGLMFRVKDNDNYYRFSMDRTNSFRRLVKKVNGTYTTIWQDTVAYTQGRDYQLEVRAQGSTITVLLDGTQLYSGSDSAHERGTIALYSWRSRNAGFDNVEVTNLASAPALSLSSGDRVTVSESVGTTPTLTIRGPANNASIMQGGSVTFTGTAIDVEDGTISNGIEWSSNVDGALGTGESVSIATLRIGTHAISASVTDSDGRQTTQTMTVTVTDADLITEGAR
jgi:YD repeat-containing protein